MAARSDGTGPALFVGGLLAVGGLFAYLGRRSAPAPRATTRAPDAAGRLALLEPTTRRMYQQLEAELASQGVRLQLGRTGSTIEQEKDLP